VLRGRAPELALGSVVAVSGSTGILKFPGETPWQAVTTITFMMK
jgi:hypothetical protein